MKSSHKALKLIHKGLSSKTVLKLTEGQINILYSKLISEEAKKLPSPERYELSTGSETFDSKGKRVTVTKTPDNKTIVTLGEKELTEKRQKKKNPYAICTSSIGKTAGTTKRSEWSKSDEKRYEACKKEVDESLKESKKSVSLFLEHQIQKIVEKHIPPKITKKDLMNYLSESPTIAPTKDPKTAPAKPETKPERFDPRRDPFPDENPAPKASESPTIAPTKNPKIAPTKPETKPERFDPRRDPFPDENPAPKANLPSPEVAKEKVIDLIMNLIIKK